MEELKVGDRVKIADDSPLARRILKESNAGDGDYKYNLFGKTGEIVGYESCRDHLEVKTIGEPSWFWPTILLEKLPAEECENIHRAQGGAVGEAFGEAMDYAAHRIVSDYMTSMEAVAKVELPKPGVAEIVFDHVVRDGKCMLELVDFGGIREPGDKNAPREYFQSEQMFGPFDGDRFIILDSDGIDKPRIGDLFTEEEAAKLVKRMRACGKRLHDINVAARAKADEERLERWKAKGQKVVRI